MIEKSDLKYPQAIWIHVDHYLGDQGKCIWVFFSCMWISQARSGGKWEVLSQFTES